MAQPERAARRPRNDALLTLLAAAMVLSVILPIGRMVHPGMWWVPGAVMVALLAAIGWAIRGLRLGAATAVIVQVVAAAIGLSALFFPEQALAGIVPDASTVNAGATTLRAAIEQIRVGVAPIPDTDAIRFALTAALCALTIIVDVLVSWLRWPLLALAAVAVLLAVPALIVPDSSDVIPAAIAALSGMLALARVRALRAGDGSAARPVAGLSRTATAATAVVAVAASFAVAPALSWVGGSARVEGLGLGPTIDASIDLGSDLRRPREAVVLSYHSDLVPPPNLRLATMTTIGDNGWITDNASTIPAWSGTVVEGESSMVSTHVVSVEIGNMHSDLLPVPDNLLDVDGVDKGVWELMPSNDTVRSSDADASGLTYSSTFLRLAPTAALMRTIPSSATDPAFADAQAVPANTPAAIFDLAAQVTAGADTDYDRARALQSWFRSEFQYSLDAPVEDGFDGTDVQAVATFLEVRSGYCVHFASAFTLMARTLGLPTRVVLGFLPGSPTGQQVDGQLVYEVTTSQLHTWPEVYFAGVGWIGFEPTASLGTPTTFAEQSTGQATPTPESTPTPTRTAADQADDTPVDDTPEQTGDTTASGAAAVPLAVVIAGIAAVLVMVPALLRAMLRRRRRVAAGAGSATAAWRELQALLADHGIRQRAGESPRAFAERAAQHGIPGTTLTPLVEAIEQASYAQDREHADGTALVAALDASSTALRSASTPSTRIVASLFPRSILGLRSGPNKAGSSAARRTR